MSNRVPGKAKKAKDSERLWFKHGVFLTNAQVKAVREGRNPFKET